VTTEYGLATSVGESEAAVDTGSLPAPGWTGAAIAVHSILQIPAPMFLRLEAVGYPPILVDFARHAFSCAAPLEQFPVHPAHVIVETEPVFPGASALFEGPGMSLDNLIWALGTHAFDGSTAPWLRASDRYRLTRWPNFTAWATTPEQVRMTAVLSNVALTANELADAAEVDVASARRLLNAFSLMGIITVATNIATGAPQPLTGSHAAHAGAHTGSEPRVQLPGAPGAARAGRRSAGAVQQPASLFRRLRDKLGW
jgi:hypothetical protein